MYRTACSLLDFMGQGHTAVPFSVPKRQALLERFTNPSTAL